MSKKQMTPQELCDAIYTTVSQSKEPLSRAEICEAIDRKKTPSTLAMIEHLHEGKWFNREYVGTRNPRIFKYVYSINRESKSEACHDLLLTG